MNTPVSVTSLTAQIKSLLETTFVQVYVEGEISNLTYHRSGHIYFSIKDESSNLSCVMFKGNAKYLKFQLEVGQKIVITGNLTVYAPRGNYQLLCNKIEPSGQGTLALAFEQLKEKLEQKGYFKIEIKKSLPKYPKTIGLITSNTGAAIEDMKKVASHRWPLVEFTIIPTLVQGFESKFDIATSIKYADRLGFDILIVARGGGSIEDLWAFNEEVVANAIYEAKTPLISAVGHEVDYLISDFVADVRAATPSNAIEIALPDINEHRIYIDSLQSDYERRLSKVLDFKQQVLANFKNLFEQNSLNSKFSHINSEIKLLKSSYENLLAQKISKEENAILFYKRSTEAKFESFLINTQNRLDVIKSSYNQNHPKHKDKKGFVQVTKNNRVQALESLIKGDEIKLQTPNYIATCTVNELQKQ